jgi:prolyl-tRNA synthetase
MAAAVEQHHDEHGVVWPASIAPYDVHVLALTGGSQDLAAMATEVAAMLEEAGHDVLLDDRDARPGEKFADADLIGCPVRITVGRRSLEDGAVDARRRDGDTDERVMIESVVKWVDAP